jgi:pyruvate dehydrogenase E1 component beta subunit
VKRPGRDLTVVTWGKMVHVSLEAAAALAQDGIDAEVLDLRTIRPLDVGAILDSVGKTHRCMVVQEGWPFASVAAEVITVLVTDGFDLLDAPPVRLTSLDVPMPYAPNLERLVLPSAERVIAAARTLLGRDAPLPRAAASVR